MRTKTCKPAGDCCVISGAVDANGHLILTLANGQQVDVGSVATNLQKQATHPALPIAAVAAAPGALPLANTGLFETADTNEITLEFGTDGKLRAKRRLFAARLQYTGANIAVAPNTQVVVPFNAILHNYGNAGSLATFGFTAPFDCLVHVDAYTFWAFEAWSSSGAVAAVTIVAKNGAAVGQIGADYSIKGGTLISGSGSEFKFAQGGVDIPCAAGDVLTIKAANGQSSGATHNVFQADASFHVVGAI